MTPDVTCSWCREHLPWYANGQLAPEERARIDRHLATCVACQQEFALWRAITGTLEDADRALPVDTAAEATWAALRTRLPGQRLLITTRDAHTRERADDLVENRQSNQSSYSTHPTHRSRPVISGKPPRRRSLLAVGAFALVIALSVAVFGVIGPQLRGHRGAGPQAKTTATPAPCATSQLKAHLPQYGSVRSISMVSARDGWAVGDIWNPNGTTAPRTLILHFQDCQWTPIASSIPTAELNQISMVSANEGWAVGSTDMPDPITDNGQKRNDWLTDRLIVLHYSNGQWQQASVPGDAQMIEAQVQMTATGEGWMLVDHGKTHPTPYTIAEGYTLLHYQNGVWTPQSMSFDVPSMLLFGFSVTPDGTCWLAGYDTNSPWGGVIATYQNGQWQTWKGSIVGRLSPSFYTITALSNQNVWVGGSNYYQDATGDHNASLILHYDGASWTQAQLPPDPNANMGPGDVMSMTMISPTEGWAFEDTVPGAETSLLHYSNGQWQWKYLPLTGGQFVSGLTMATPTQGWAIVNVYESDSATSMSFPVGSFVYYNNGTWTPIGG
jgi:hypothetical protein